MHKDEVKPDSTGDWRRWLALIPLGLGTLIVALDSTVLNISLPSIRKDLGFDENSLTWVVNAYVLAYGSLLLLSGRLADIYGPRKLFRWGIVLFTIASLVCGVASTQTVLILGRLLQGIGGSVMTAVSLTLAVSLFSATAERTKAIATIGFVGVIGGSVGLVVGGVVTSMLGWHWVFLLNGPIGVLVYVACVALLPVTGAPSETQRVDIWGAVTVTASLLTALYTVSSAGRLGFITVRTLGLLGCSLVLLVAFLLIEMRVSVPLMPLHIFKKRSLVVANVVCVLSSAAAAPWSYLTTLYMGGVLGYGPLRISLVFLPSSIVGAVFALGLSAKLVSELGVRWSVGGGLLLGALGLVLFAVVTGTGATMQELLLCMILVGIGAGVGFNALSVAVLTDVPTSEAGLASGIVNTTSLMGGAIGLAILASVASSHTGGLLAAGAKNGAAMAGSYRIAFLAGAACVSVAALLGATFLRSKVPDGDRESSAVVQT